MSNFNELLATLAAQQHHLMLGRIAGRLTERPRRCSQSWRAVGGSIAVGIVNLQMAACRRPGSIPAVRRGGKAFRCRAGGRISVFTLVFTLVFAGDATGHAKGNTSGINTTATANTINDSGNPKRT